MALRQYSNASRKSGSRKAAATKQRRSLDPPPFVDPLTAERLYTDEEREFLSAVDAYRKRYGHRFLNACDYLEIVKSLGYRKP